MENNNCISSVNFVLYAKNCLQLFSDNHGQKCWEGNFILQIPPSPFSMLDFPGEKKGDFCYLKNSNIEYGGGGPQEHGISQILQPVVRKIKLGVK